MGGPRGEEPASPRSAGSSKLAVAQSVRMPGGARERRGVEPLVLRIHVGNTSATRIVTSRSTAWAAAAGSTGARLHVRLDLTVSFRGPQGRLGPPWSASGARRAAFRHARLHARLDLHRQPVGPGPGPPTGAPLPAFTFVLIFMVSRLRRPGRGEAPRARCPPSRSS
jgi:hypothetical protein